MNKKINVNDSDIYIKKIKNMHYLFNPNYDQGVALIDDEAKQLLTSLLSDEECKELDLSNSDTKKVLEEFKRFGLIKSSKHDSNKKKKSLSIWLHITNQCNLRCKYCFISHTSQVMPWEVIEKGLEKSFESAERFHMDEVIVKFAGGEPTLERELIFKTALYARKLAKKFKIAVRFALLTNGVLLSKGYANALKKNDIHVAISIDGLNEDHDATRVFINGKGSYKFVNQGLINLLENNNSFNVTLVINKNNLMNLDETVRYFLDNNINFGLRFVKDNPLIQSDLIPSNEELIEGLRRVIKLIREKMPKKQLYGQLLDFVTFKPQNRVCGTGRNYLVISHKGTISSCQMMINQPIGTINDKCLVQTMREKNFAPNLSNEDKEGCNTCEWKSICAGGCPY